MRGPGEVARDLAAGRQRMLFLRLLCGGRSAPRCPRGAGACVRGDGGG
jgi:hypothetical protein